MTMTTRRLSTMSPDVLPHRCSEACTWLWQYGEARHVAH